MAAVSVYPLPALLDSKRWLLQQGRALQAVPVFKAADGEAEVIAHVWPDSVVTILDSNANWYRVKEGFVARTGTGGARRRRDSDAGQR